MHPLIQPKRATSLFLVALACFGLSPMAQAFLPPPPPDGGYPGSNTAEGDFALYRLTTGFDNTAIGTQALVSNMDGDYNTAIGAFTLSFNVSGNQNTATGVSALESNTASNNTADGFEALFMNETGASNTAIGANALRDNNTGVNNTATGYRALENNTNAPNNTATGFQAMLSNQTGDNNTATGTQALFVNITGNSNTAMGFNALRFNTGTNNIGIGSAAGQNLTTGNNNIDIGALGMTGESNKIRIGKQNIQNGTFIAGIFGVALSGNPVVVSSSGKLGVSTSSARYKQNVKSMDKASEAVLALRPVTFRYKYEIDPAGTSQFGLVAEEVEKVNPDLVARDEEGKAYTVRYDAVNAMLLNEFLKAHRKIEEQGAMIENQKAAIARQQKQIEALTTGLQKVSAELELSKAASQTVLNNQ
jgi:Chaperone of endosialidase